MPPLPPRVWVDARNAIFRRGLVACLHSDGFAVAGESTGLEPAPALAGIQVLLFEIDGHGLQEAARLARGTECRLVGLARLRLYAATVEQNF